MTTIYLATSGTLALDSLQEYSLFSDSDPIDILVAYPFLKAFLAVKNNIKIGKWCLDSGAFSAFNSGKVINLQEYIDTCKALTAHEVFGLDVIGDYKAGMRNLEEMWAQGVSAIPTYHPGEPWSVLDWACKHSDKIAVGSGDSLHSDKNTKRGAAFDYIDQVFARVWPKKIHGFALARKVMCNKYPFHSCDSTSWILTPQVYGYWNMFSGHLNGVGKQVSLKSRGVKKFSGQVRYWVERGQYYKWHWKKEMALLNVT